LGLGVEGIQRDQSALEVQVRKELLRAGNLVGLGVDHGAAQVILAGHAEGGERALTAAMLGFFAVQGDQLVLGRGTAQLRLNLPQDLLQLRPINLHQQTPKSGLAWGRVAVLAPANAQGAALGLTRSLKRISQWCQKNLHEPLRVQVEDLGRKLKGHFGYYGITGNYQALQ